MSHGKPVKKPSVFPASLEGMVAYVMAFELSFGAVEEVMFVSSPNPQKFTVYEVKKELARYQSHWTHSPALSACEDTEEENKYKTGPPE